MGQTTQAEPAVPERPADARRAGEGEPSTGPSDANPGTRSKPSTKETVASRLTWTLAQRTALLAVLCVLLIALAVRYARNPVFVSDPQPERPSRYADLADRIDPNTANVPTLAALPTIGRKRAETIIAYRESFAARHPGQLAFQRLEDLAGIRGIGPATLDALRPYLAFPKVMPVTRPKE